MSSEGRDPLDELRGRWESVVPPAPGGDLDAEDEAVRAPLERLRAAWRAVEPAPEQRRAAHAAVHARATELARSAPGRADFARAGERRPRAGERRRLGALAAAAALLASIGAALWLAARDTNGPRSDGRGFVASAVEGQAPAAPQASAPRLAAVASDRIEIRSGNVRLVWLTDLAPGTTAETLEPDETQKDE